jgi:hypothetical protein
MPDFFIAGSCARAASGHTVAPPSRVMNSRRFISTTLSAIAFILFRVSHPEEEQRRTAHLYSSPLAGEHRRAPHHPARLHC